MLKLEVIVIEDTQGNNRLKELVALHRSGSRSDTLTNLAKFLSTPLDDVFSEESGRKSLVEEKTVAILNVVTTLLRLFLFR